MNIALHIIPLLVLAAYVFLLLKTELKPKVLKRSALVILLLGTAIYMWGYAVEGYKAWWVTVFLRSLVSAAKMFIYSTDLCEVLQVQKEPLFLEAFMTVFYAAIITSVSALLMLFSRRVATFFILNLRRKKFKHVFLGINSRSLMLAKGLEGNQVAFIEFPDQGSDAELSATTLLTLAKSDNVSHRKAASNAITLRAKRGLMGAAGATDILDYIGLKQLRRLIDKETSFYIFGDDESKNLEDMLAFIEDASLRDNTIHVCLQREGLAGAYKSVLGKTGVHFIYPSSMSVVELMDTPGYQPIDVMSVSPVCPGTVEGSFNALVIGFEETGQAATKFIYEFSSAICQDGSILPVKIHVCDEHIQKLSGQFIFANPGMEYGKRVIYHNSGFNSGVLWKALKEHLDEWNYIVLATPNDAQNLEMACTIYEYASKMRKGGLENLLILVRKRNTPDYESSLVNRLNGKAGKKVIVCFGEYEKIFTADRIVSKDASGINSVARNLGEEMQRRYEQLIIAEKLESETNGESTFHQKRRDRREAHQFISRANHLHTKEMMLGDAPLRGDTLEYLSRCEHLRFLRYLAAHGYSFSPEDDDVLKTNHQICPWEELSETDKEYHRNMVRASLMK